MALIKKTDFLPQKLSIWPGANSINWVFSKNWVSGMETKKVSEFHENECEDVGFH